MSLKYKSTDQEFSVSYIDLKYDGNEHPVFTIDSEGTVDFPDGLPAGELADGSITAAKLASNAVESAKINALAVTTAKIAAQGVTFAKTLMFVSTEQTGTGAPQNIAHGLGVIPAAVLIVPTDTAPAVVGVYTAVEGTHTITNVVVTLTSGKKFKVWAMG